MFTCFSLLWLISSFLSILFSCFSVSLVPSNSVSYLPYCCRVSSTSFSFLFLLPLLPPFFSRLPPTPISSPPPHPSIPPTPQPRANKHTNLHSTRQPWSEGESRRVESSRVESSGRASRRAAITGGVKINESLTFAGPALSHWSAAGGSPPRLDQSQARRRAVNGFDWLLMRSNGS